MANFNKNDRGVIEKIVKQFDRKRAVHPLLQFGHILVPSVHKINSNLRTLVTNTSSDNEGEETHL